ncbi:MAG: NAD-dependent deacylase [bacterium]|nr:NAD-dependent deacylase [bacterium]
MIKDILLKGKIVALTGAGMSEESGISTFRGKGGIWERYNPAIYANIPGLSFTFIIRPHKVIDFIVDFYEPILNAEPNPGHLALAKLEENGALNSIITQNVDDLHTKAGNKVVIELHGNMFRFRCMRCSNKRKLDKKELTELLSKLEKNRNSRLAITKFFVPCKCGRRMRPDVVLFGESLPEAELKLAYKEIENCNTLLLVGTSGVVYPAAYLPAYAKERGKPIVEINPERTKFSEFADYFIAGKAGEVLPQILQEYSL